MFDPLPVQSPDIPWPTAHWPVGDPPPGVDRARLHAILDAIFADPQPETTVQTDALLVVHRGRIVAERYGNGHGPDTPQPSWSMAKSILQAVVGVLVRQGRLDVSKPADVPEWRSPGDPRRRITLDQLLHMTSGLHFVEDYVDGEASDTIKMLFVPGADDMGAYAAAFPLDGPPDTISNYSSGTSNVISGIIKRLVGPGEEYGAFLRHELFGRIGVTSAEPRFDRAGGWIASSFCFCTPRDFAKFGLLYLRNGVWDGERILPEGWVDYARMPAPVQPVDDDGYGAHWWLLGDDLGTFYASGYAGQRIYLVPPLDLIIVRNGNTPVERAPHIATMAREIIACFRGA